MEQKRIKVRLTKNSPYSNYGYYEKGDIGYIDGYVNDNAVIILENGKFAKADLRWIEAVNEEDKNVQYVEQKPTDNKMKEILRTEYEKGRADAIEEMQKTVWNEGDEAGLCDTLWAIKQARTIAKDENDMGNVWYAEHWLKSLIDRVQPQPKQEWSEEDERIRIETIELLETANHPNVLHRNGKPLDFTENINWLKSLKDKYTCKLSSEQIKVCKEVYADILSTKGFDLGTVNSELNRLEEQLKKL